MSSQDSFECIERRKQLLSDQLYCAVQIIDNLTILDEYIDLLKEDNDNHKLSNITKGLMDLVSKYDMNM